MSVDSNKLRTERMLAMVGAALKPYVEGVLEQEYGANWRRYAAFPDTVIRGGELDTQGLLRLFQNEWRDVFSKRLGHNARDAATAINAGRNAWAHLAPGGDVAADVTLRALTGGAELLEAIKAPNAREARAQADAFLAMLARKQVKDQAAAPIVAASALPRTALTLANPSAPAARPEQMGLAFESRVGALEPWRLIAPPREDITSGELSLDHFAADLAVVDRGEAGGAYGDPIEFFRSTFITGGLKLVLESGAARLARGMGPSVIGLQTNFGGGKTHTMLALLHLVRASDPLRLPGVKEILGESASGLKGAKAVAFSGADKGPDVPLAIAGGRAVRTIWGYLAWRLAGEEGLSLIAGAEEAGTNPGAEALTKVLGAAGGPALVLLDEIVAYVKQLEAERYEAALAFFQSLTEAAGRTPRALVVGSLPESEDEAGGDRGKQTLARLERLFGRVQSSWQAAQGAETYGIVRRRLFQELDAGGEKARDATVAAYRKFYRANRASLPAGVDDERYEALMREAYPVHPLLFDKLAMEWGGLDRFQRTRGVLKFVAESARRIWLEGSDEPLILPGSVPLADPLVRGAVLEPLDGPAWPSIVDGDVDSDRSVPWALDLEKKNQFGQRRVATRVARALFLGTAPRGEARGGMSRNDVRLACARPDEAVAVFGDALAELESRASHIYTSGQAYWFGSQPTLRKLVLTRAQAIGDDDADAELAALLRTDSASRGRFARVHVCLDNPEEVEEANAVALVVLHPRTAHEARSDASPATVAATDAVARRSGGRLRLGRNALLFVAAEAGTLAEARKAAKLHLAWTYIDKDRSLDLKDSQRKDVAEQISRARGAMESAMRRAWSQVLTPVPATDGRPFDIAVSPVRAAAGKSVAAAVWDRAAADSLVFDRLGPVTLADRIRGAWPVGEQHLPLAKLRDWFAQFVAFERLRDETVLADAVGAMLHSTVPEYAYAEGVTAEGTYFGLSSGAAVQARFDGEALLVRADVAAAQLARAHGVGGLGRDGPLFEDPPGPPGTDGAPPPRLLRKFVGEVELDPTRAVRDVTKIMDEVVSQLLRTPGAKVRLRLDVEANALGGFATDDAAVVRDNAHSLKFDPAATRFEGD